MIERGVKRDPVGRRRGPIATRLLCRALLLGALVASVAPPAAEADELVIGDVTHRNIRVTGVQRDLLLYETRTGKRRQALIRNVALIRLSDHPEVGEAEALAGAGEFAEAAALYEQALQAMDEGDLKLLMRARLIASLDGAGEAERAVEQFLALLEEDHSPVALSARPRRFPADAEQRESLAQRVEQRIRRTPSAIARRSMQQLLAALRADPQPPEDDASASRRRQGGDGERDASVEQMIAAGRFSEALAAIDEALVNGDGALPRRLHQRGIVLGELGEHRDAALAFMRVVIHYPTARNPYYIPSLLEAARVFVEMDQPEHARRLRDEARQAGADAAQLEEIDQLLGSLP